MEPNKRKPDVSHARCVNNITWPTGWFLCTVSSLYKNNNLMEVSIFFLAGAGRTYTEIAGGRKQFDRHSIAAQL